MTERGMVDPHQRETTPLGPGSPHGRGAARRPDRATERKLWFAILAPPAAWTLAELIGYALVGRGCSDAVVPRNAGLTGSLDAWQWLVGFGVPIAAALVAAAAMLVALRVFREWRTSAIRITHANGWNRVEFMAMAGAIISFFLLLNVVYFAVLPAIVDPCLRTT